MDRAAKLAEIAKKELAFEAAWSRRGYGDPGADSKIRAFLWLAAKDLGFAPNEISAAIDQALKDAGSTP